MIGSCYELEQDDGWKYNCRLTDKGNCDGYWVSPVDSNTPYCTSSYRPSDPVRSGSYYYSPTMGLTAFEAIGLTSGMEFQGGVYIGIFKPGPLNGTSSIVRGNINFGSPSSNTFGGDSVGGTFSQWAVIADHVPFSTSFLNTDEPDVNHKTSLWDGYYNTYGDNNTFFGISTVLTNTLNSYPRKGFIDYYMPSIYELGFLAEYLYTKNITIPGFLISSSIFNTKYLNQSSNKSRFGANSYVYGQNMFSGPKQYRNIVIDKRDNFSAIFFRRIILT